MAKDLFIDLLYVEKVSDDTRTDNQFKELLNRLEKEFYNTTPKFEIDYKKAYSNKRKYYNKLIENEYIKNFNSIIDALEINSTSSHLSFIYTKEYNRIKSYLTQISKYIAENDVNVNLYLTPTLNDRSDESYIISFLKTNAMMLFMEIQERFSEYSDEEIYTIDELHEVFFNEEPQIDLLIKPYEGKPIKTKNTVTKSKKFKAIKGDLESRDSNPKILAYSEIVNPSKETQFLIAEERLFENEIIDNNYTFNSKKGNKIILAAFIFRLYNMNYFNQRTFSPLKTIKERDITKFFANRYGNGSDANKEFRNFKGIKKHQYYKIIDAHYWLSNIS
ncbi:MAG: DUF6617 family protein [Lutibacter sp.]|uniref:DUF6617 family protein n=1 Tax=Lutibacter sp. TaxID=1925666 RepID=UPI00299CEBF0|nr:DUF6617 family protein [Lutibacter sp.]MDX1828228.1 DUF6617 family protein [Lutibacter sp.]